jgi:hypothetical protein
VSTADNRDSDKRASDNGSNDEERPSTFRINAEHGLDGHSSSPLFVRTAERGNEKTPPFLTGLYTEARDPLADVELEHRTRVVVPVAVATIALTVVSISAMAVPVAATVAPLFITVSVVPAIVTIFTAAVIAVILGKLDARRDRWMLQRDGSGRGGAKACYRHENCNYRSADRRDNSIHGYAFPVRMCATMPLPG